MKKKNLKFITMTNYDKNFKNVNVLFEKKNIENTLGEILSKNSKIQIRIAETEKYPHVTYFFNEVEKNLLMVRKEFYATHQK